MLADDDGGWESNLMEDLTALKFGEAHKILISSAEVLVHLPARDGLADLKLQVKDMRLVQEYSEDGTWHQLGK